MQSLRIPALIGLLTLALFLASCGSVGYSSTTPAASSSSSSATPTSSATGDSSYSKYPSSAATPTTSASTSTASVVKTTTATVDGKSQTILTNAQGLTLYYFTPDTKTTTACGSGCVGIWPPLLVSGSDKPTGTPGISGTLMVVSNANGQQVQYNGHFLYTYSGDSASGQTNGEGSGGQWFVATTSLS